MMLELPTWAAERWRSDLMASGIKGGKANQERKATKKPTVGFGQVDARRIGIVIDRRGMVSKMINDEI